MLASLFSQNKKVRQPKSAHKNANSSRRQTNYIQIGYITTLSIRNLHFIKFNKESIAKKGYRYPQKENTPIDCIFSLFAIVNYITISDKMQEHLKKLSSIKTKSIGFELYSRERKRLRRFALRAVLRHCRNARGATFAASLESELFDSALLGYLRPACFASCGAIDKWSPSPPTKEHHRNRGGALLLANDSNFDTKLTENKGDNRHLPCYLYLLWW